MKLIALREMIGDYGRVREGDIFDVDDVSARRLIQRGLAKPWRPVQSSEPPREIQAFIRAPEEKNQPPSTSSSRPLVSCIMPTADRPRFVPGAVRNFLEQTYEPKELIVIDDGKIPAEIPTHPSIRAIRIRTGDARRTIGEKRNLAIREYARGEIIAHWDDDDRYAPDRLESQVMALNAAHVATGYRDIDFIDERGSRFRMTGTVDYAAGTSLCYWREWALAHPFPATNVSEDNAFLKEAAGRVLVLPGQERVVARIHRDNTVKKRPGGQGWTRLPKKELPRWANI